MPRSIRILLPLLASAALVACGQAPAPVASAQADAQNGNTELRDIIQKPIQRAKDVDKVIEAAKDKQDSQLQDEENGNASSASQ
jgi:hypothetical protein